MKDALKKQLARCRKGLCLLLVLACLLPLSGPAVVMEAGAVTQAEVNALKKKSQGLSQQKKDLQNQLKTIQANKSDAVSYRALVDLFARLPQTYRAALEMRFLLGYSNKEIAQRLCLTQTAVNTRIARGRELLKKLAQEEGIHP